MNNYSKERENKKNVGCLFQPWKDNWGLRGDPFLWDEMSIYLSKEPLPASVSQLMALVEKSFLQLAGTSISDTSSPSIYVARFDQGGVSGGHICTDFWRNTVLPELHRRYLAIKYEDSLKSPRMIDKPCRYESYPGGCRFGTTCRFNHSQPVTNFHGLNHKFAPSTTIYQDDMTRHEMRSTHSRSMIVNHSTMNNSHQQYPNNNMPSIPNAPVVKTRSPRSVNDLYVNPTADYTKPSAMNAVPLNHPNTDLQHQQNGPSGRVNPRIDIAPAHVFMRHINTTSNNEHSQNVMMYQRTPPFIPPTFDSSSFMSSAQVRSMDPNMVSNGMSSFSSSINS